MSKAIQLIYKDKDDQLRVNPDALNTLKGINGPIGICSIIGPYRQGKSFIMSRLVDQPNAFELGHQDVAYTKGVWMWSKPIQHKNKNGEEMSLIILDTEGLESDDASEEWDTKIFILTILLSSYFMYNSKNALKRDDINKLAITTTLSERIKYKSIGTNNTVPRSDLPDFMFIIRDYFFQRTSSSKDRLLKYLGQYNLREAFERSFNNLDCYYLCKPVDKDKDLLKLDTLDPASLSDDFKSQMEGLCKIIKGDVKPKRIQDTQLNGKLYANYIEEIIECLNKNKEIFVDSIVQSTLNAIAQNILDKVKSDYKNQMTTKLKNTPLKWNEWEKIEKEINDECVEKIEEELQIFGSICDEFKKKFAEFRLKIENNEVVDGEKLKFKRLNSNAIKFDCNEKLGDLWFSIKQKFSENFYKNMLEFNNDIVKLKQDYKKNTILSPEQITALDNFNKNINQYQNFLQKKIDDQERLEQERKKEKEENEKAQRELEEKRRKQEEEEERIKKEYERKQRELEEIRKRIKEDEDRRRREIEESRKKIEELRTSLLNSINVMRMNHPTYSQLYGAYQPGVHSNNAAFTSRISSAPTYSYSHVASPGGYHARTNGLPDMRYSVNKNLFGSSGPHYRKDGGLDMRYRSSRKYMGKK